MQRGDIMKKNPMIVVPALSATVAMLAAVAMLASCSLFGPKTGTLEGLEIHFSASAEGSRDVFTLPGSASVGFSKIWFPSESRYSTLIAGNLSNRYEGIIPLNHAGLANDLAHVSN